MCFHKPSNDTELNPTRVGSITKLQLIYNSKTNELVLKVSSVSIALEYYVKESKRSIKIDVQRAYIHTFRQTK